MPCQHLQCPVCHDRTIHTFTRSCQVGNGCDPRTAWEACGQPKGKPGLQNIRKRGYKLRREQEAIEDAAQALHVDVATPEQADEPVQAEVEGWGNTRIGTVRACMRGRRPA